MWVHLQRLVIGNLPICPTQGLEHKLSAEKMHSINLTENNKKKCLSLHDNEQNNYLFVNGTEIINLNQKVLQ